MAAAQSYFSQDAPKIVVQSLFEKYDKDKNGSLKKEELSVLLKDDFGMDSQRAEAAAMLLDKDGSGIVSFEEFFQWFSSGEGMSNVSDESRYHYVKKAVDLFKRFDTNKNGTIDRDELQHLMRSIGFTQSLDSAFEQLDKDKNGKISFPEFIVWLNWLPPSK